MNNLEKLRSEAESLKHRDPIAYREARKKYLLAQAEYYAKTR